MQLRGPPEKGSHAYACRFVEFSGRNRSGSNFKGSLQYFSLRWRCKYPSTAFEPFGITISPKEMSSVMILPTKGAPGNRRRDSLITRSVYFSLDKSSSSMKRSGPRTSATSSNTFSYRKSSVRSPKCLED
jgi:hypothetical protein